MFDKWIERWEFACKCGCGLDTVDAELLLVLESLRAHFGCAVYIISGCRCSAHDKAIQKKYYPDLPYTGTSQHLFCRAADIRVKKATPREVYEYLHNRYPDRFGMGLYDTFVHIDTKSGAARRWNRTT
jgi:uncharacterized protein YcbK (DUF882 family)